MNGHVVRAGAHETNDIGIQGSAVSEDRAGREYAHAFFAQGIKFVLKTDQPPRSGPGVVLV